MIYVEFVVIILFDHFNNTLKVLRVFGNLNDIKYGCEFSTKSLDLCLIARVLQEKPGLNIHNFTVHEIHCMK